MEAAVKHLLLSVAHLRGRDEVHSDTRDDEQRREQEQTAVGGFTALSVSVAWAEGTERAGACMEAVWETRTRNEE